MLAWHFTRGHTLRDGSPLVVGQTYRYDGPLIPCESGLHASERLIDALAYAPGYTLSRVKLSGEMIPHGNPPDKWVVRERTPLWTVDVTRTLHEFKCWCAGRALAYVREAGRVPDPRSVAAVQARKDWLDGKIDDKALLDAHADAEAAVREADVVVYDAVDDAAEASYALDVAVLYASRVAAYAAVESIDEASCVADAASIAAAKAVGYASVYAATRSASVLAIYVARSTAYAAEREAQNRELTRMVEDLHASTKCA